MTCSCLDDGAPFQVIAEYHSPSGKMKAVLFTRDCGATCDFQNSVSIVPVDEVGDAMGIASSPRRQGPFRISSAVRIRFRQFG